MAINAEPRNKIWIAGQLKVWPQRYGIDLLDNEIGIELKSCSRKYKPKFTIHEYQVHDFPRDNPAKELFWAFLMYDVRIRSSGWQIRDREMWLIPWGFAHSLKVHQTPFQTYRYVYRTTFPYDLVTFQKPGGILHVPRASILEERLTEPARIYQLAR